MLRVHLPLLPLPVLAIIVAISACSKTSSDEPETRVVPPAASYAALAAAPKAAVPKAAVPDEPTPSAQDVKEFERPVQK